jgi:hypothetical protein
MYNWTTGGDKVDMDCAKAVLKLLGWIFIILVIIAFVVVIWFALYGWRVLWDGYLWYYFI